MDNSLKFLVLNYASTYYLPFLFRRILSLMDFETCKISLDKFTKNEHLVEALIIIHECISKQWIDMSVIQWTCLYNFPLFKKIMNNYPLKILDGAFATVYFNNIELLQFILSNFETRIIPITELLSTAIKLNRSHKIINQLIEHYDLSESQEYKTPLFYAIHQEDIKTIKALLKKGAEPNSVRIPTPFRKKYQLILKSLKKDKQTLYQKWNLI